MKHFFLFIALIFISPALHAQNISLTDAQALEIGKKLWKNECDETVEGLTSWNEGEEFASLGIGHFIWYPQGMEGPFDESFPKLLDFFKTQKIVIPAWLRKTPDCPWKTKKEFEKDFHSPRMNELRAFLKDTVALQARFAANRLEKSLPKILEQAPVEDREKIRENFYRVAATPNGFYALMDYVNFKGEGIKETERYNGEGWGLLQVLQNMKETSQTAVDEFVNSATQILIRRVKNSPLARGEARWLKGWKARLQTYRK